MTITRGDLENLLVPGLNKLTGLSYNEVVGEHKPLFDISKSERAFEEDQHIVGFGEAVKKEEGDAIHYDDARATWTSRYTAQTYGLAFKITQEAVDDNLYEDQAEYRSKLLGRSLGSTKEQVCANIFNNGFDTAYLGGDGVPLFADNHPTLSDDFDNKGTAQMSETALQDIVTAVSLYKDDRGILIGAKAKMLAIPPALMWEVEAIMKSTLSTVVVENAGNSAMTNTNNINTLRTTGVLPGGYVVNRRFSSDSNYFVKTDIPNGTRLFQRKELTYSMDGEFDNDNVKYKATERYSVGWSDPRGWYGVAAS